MATGRLERYRERLRGGIERTLAAEHTPGEIAASFAIGTFVTALPTAGTGLVLFIALAYRFERISKLALFAPGLLLNPLVKGGVYTGGFLLGEYVLGPVPGVTIADVSVMAGPAIVFRLVLGTAIIAACLAAIGYVAVGLTVRMTRRHGIGLRGLVAGGR